jgi:hypothetical protein
VNGLLFHFEWVNVLDVSNPVKSVFYIYSPHQNDKAIPKTEDADTKSSRFSIRSLFMVCSVEKLSDFPFGNMSP